ncbi:MAG: hypothetical protein HN590_00785 [Calditrichaeota bacterium]|nr:hypothetical protein [Calditrichota bacterium]
MPITDAEVIVGKYLAALALLISMLIPTIVYTVIVAILGDIDMGPVIGGYMGLALMGAGYLAIGTFGSSMTENQVVAYITSWLMVFAFFLMDKMLFILPNWLVTPVEYLSIEYHFQNISRGVIDSRDLIYYLSLVVLTLMLASRSLAARRWR